MATVSTFHFVSLHAACDVQSSYLTFKLQTPECNRKIRRENASDVTGGIRSGGSFADRQTDGFEPSSSNS